GSHLGPVINQVMQQPEQTGSRKEICFDFKLQLITTYTSLLLQFDHLVLADAVRATTAQQT
ncbi:unnamed protein product, partial [Amoebophrya sp. A25]